MHTSFACKARRTVRAILYSVLLLALSLTAGAEGTKEVMPNSGNGVGLYINPSLASGPYRGAGSENRVRFYIADASTENLYFGIRTYNRNSTPAEVATMYYRIINPSGTQVALGTITSTAGSTGHINTYAQATAGPNIGGAVPAGYNPAIYDPTVAGEYYIEVYESTDNGATASASQTNICIYFDFTVATTGNTRYSGRVHSQAWSLITYNTSTFAGDNTVPMQSTFYGYTADSTVSKVAFNAGFKPLACVVAFNKFGAVYTGDWYADRKSQNTGTTQPSLPNGYKLFLNSPASLYTRSAAPSTPAINSVTGCPGSYTVNYTISMPGDVAILLDLNGTDGYQFGTSDLYLTDTSKAAGTYNIAWDGKDGLGNSVSTTTAKMTLYLRRGRINLPIYDAELNVNGMAVTGLEPVTYTPRLYFNDALLTTVGSGCTTTTSNNQTTTAGPDSSINGMAQVNYSTFGFVGRAWNGTGSGGSVPAPAGGGGDATSTLLCDDYGNIRTLNTWWWGNETASSQSTYALPNCKYIAGTVYDDINAGTINGTAISTASSTQLYIYVVNTATGLVVAKQALTDGTFAFGASDGVSTSVTTYRLVLSSSNVAVGAATPSASLPAGWVNTGEGLSGGTGDGAANGTYTIGQAVTTYTNFAFGIDALPSPTALTTAASQANPGSTNTVTIPATTFSGTDAVDVSGGQVSYIHITAFPTNTTTLSLASGATSANGTYGALSYTSATFPGGGVYVATNTSGNPTSAIMVDPVNGAVNVDVTYKAVDQALQESSTTGIARQPLTDLTISGSVYDDVNGGTIDGTLISNAGGQLYVNLVNTASNTVVSSKTVTSGAFSFATADGLANNITTYKLVLASSAAATTAALPTTAWANTAEGTSGSTGDGTADGSFSFAAAVTGSQVIDFGIDNLPTTTALTTASSQTNPGGTNTVTVPATTFSGTDADAANGGTVSYIHITSFPTNATSISFAAGASSAGSATSSVTYTSATFPAGGVYVATNTSGNPTSAITVDPVNGAVNVDISYKAVDNASKESLSAGIARQPLADFAISGSVYDDVNGGTINGTLISSASGQLYVNLVNTATSTLVASKAVTSGAYSFSTADGLQNNVSTYTLVLTNSATATASTLPSTAWTYTAEGVSGGSGDGTANGTYSFGANVTANATIDFGVDALPTATVLTTATSQSNPGGTNPVTIPSTTFNATDADAANGGTVNYIHVIAFPSNATSISFAAGAATAGGATSSVSYTSATFPAGGVYVATNTSGNPTSAITVDPVNGAVNIDISYKAVDNAGKESLTAGVARQPLTDLTISGSVYDDPDAGIINGTLRSNAGGQLYVNLVNGATVVASKAVSGAGTYSFTTADGLLNNVSTYTLVLTNSASATTSTLPSAAFTYTAEGVTGTSGDGTANGSYAFGANITANATIDFGIDALPTVTSLNTASSQVNPGGTSTVTIPATTFSGADASDLSGGQVDYIHITTFPTNATTVSFASAATSVNGTYSAVSYTSATFPAGGVYLATNSSGNPAGAITVDPVNGAVNVDFTYSTIDNAGKESSATGTARQPLTDLQISGTVYDDVNGSNNGLIDGTAISNAGGQLYVNLVNTAINTVVASKTLTNGTYVFTTANGVQNNVTTYSVILASSATATTASLPSAAWTNTAEGISGSSGDANVNGGYQFGAAVTGSQVIDFGIDALPVPATLTTATAQTNPGGTSTVTIPATTFSGTDATDLSGGQIAYIHITSFPTNATSVNFANAATSVSGTYGALSYTANQFPAGGVYVATNTGGNPTSAITVDPVNGAVNVDFTYSVLDNAGKESSTTGVARQPLTDLTISGLVYDDVNGGTINGSLISSAAGQLYVNLVNTATNTVVASKAVTSGAYSFGTADGLLNNVSTYQLVLASTATATTASLPTTGWVNMAEGLSGGSGDGAANGSYSFGAVVTGNTSVDFAIEALPVPAALTTATSQTNPGGTNTVTVPATTFSASDASDLSGGQVNYIHITSFPTNTTTVNFASAATSANGTYSAVSYTSATFPAGGVYLATNASGNPSGAITVDPVNGAVNVDFTYTAIDNSGKESVSSGIARQPLSDLTISGTLYDDANGSKDNTINGTATGSASGTQLYANLVNTGTNTVVASVALPTSGSTGTFTFGSANGVQTGVSYAVVIATNATATSGSLPANWVNTAEGLSGTSGDALANGLYTVGAISSPQALAFGINIRPTVSSTTITAQADPGGSNTVTIPASAFPATDADSNGGIAYVHLTAFPSNATSITVTGALTAGGAVTTTTYTSANFPAGGVYIGTDNYGNLQPVDALAIDPVNGATSSAFAFEVIDIAGQTSSNSGVTTVPFITGAISGTVYNDFDGITDATLDGVGTNLSGQLYVNAVSGGTVVASATVASNGTYVIMGLGAGTYSLVLTTSNSSTTAALPSGWTFTSEGTTSAGDGDHNGTQTVVLSSNGVAGANFGIDGKPTATSNAASTQVNPGGSNTITIPASTFSGTDLDAATGGRVNYVHITAFPGNATSITVTGALTAGGAVSTNNYTSGNFPAGGIYIATNSNGNLADASALSVDPVDGAVTISISYTVVDNGGQESTNTATASQPLSDLSISGTVYDDANGGTISGTPISNAGGQLYVNLVNTATSTVVASKTLTNGTFTFGTADGLQNNVSTYALILASSATATSSTLPSAAWTYTAEGVSGSSGDGTANGAYSFGGSISTSQVIDFGIDALPTAQNNTATSQANPGGTNTVTVPATAFSGTDAGDGASGLISYVHLTAFPTNATSITVIGSTSIGGAVTTTTYTSADFPVAGVYIATTSNGNLSDANAVKADPVNGAVSVAFTYAVVDNAGVQSAATATATQPLTDIFISGTVYDDANAGTIDGTPISNAGGQLYVNLVNTASNTVVASKTLTDGTFSFSTADGLDNSVTTYQLMLTNSASATVPVLPSSAWVNTGEGNSGTSGDATVNGRFVFGGAVGSSRVIDFGIDALPVPASITVAATQANPGSTNTVTIPATTFSASDATDLSGGQVNYIRITSFPTNATTVSFASAATSVNGTYGALSYTSATFPVAGVYVATNTSGNPTGAITVDPVNGAVTVDFSYRAIDNAGKEGSSTGIARQPLADLFITGNVYDDVDAGIIDGTRISTAGGQLYVNLVDTATATVIASKQLTDGTFSFGTANGLSNTVTTYKLVLTTGAALATPALPSTAWVNTAEGLGNSSGDGNANGGYALGGAVTSNVAVDFGLDARPVAVPLTVATPKVNPGGNLFVGIANNLPLAADPVDVTGGQVKLLHVLSLPVNANAVIVKASETPGGALVQTTYTSSNFPAGGIYVATNASGSTLDSFYVDPVNGADTVLIQFRAIDEAGVESQNTGIGKIPFTDLTISGNVYDDVNGNNDGLINGTLISNAGGQLYVNLVDGTNTVISSKAVTSGAFSFGTADGLRNDVTTYRLILASSATATTQGLPSATAWVNTGEGPDATPDGLANGRYTLSVAVSSPMVVDFGINARPVTDALTTAITQQNPGGTATVTVPATTFSANDATDVSGGVVSYIHITTFPSNTTTVNFASAATSVNGSYSAQSYTAASFPAGGVYLAANSSGNPSGTITVDPVGGAVNVDFTYTSIDQAGTESNASGIARQPLSDILITGTVYDDANAGTINGTAIANAGGQLYVNLVNTATNTVVASKTLTDGTYSFGSADGIEAAVTTYQLVLAASPTATTAALPSAAWVNTAEGTSGTAGDGSINGLFSFSGALAATQTIDFAIEALPVAATNTAATQVNPGGATNATVPATAFSGSDATDLAGGRINYVHITGFPTNATSITLSGALTAGGAVSSNSYTSANFPAGGIYIASGSNGNLTDAMSVQVDPVDGAVTVVIPYKVVDNAGQESSAAATASQPFSTLLITGTLYDDYNALNDGLLNGLGSNGGGLYVNAVNGGGQVVASSAVASDGTYSLSGLNAGNYTLTLTTSASATGAAVNSGWVLTGEGSGSTADGTADGLNLITLAGSNLTGINFGIERLAVADAKSYTMGPNTNPAIAQTTIPSSANPANSYAARITLSGASSSGATPGALTGLDPDGSNGFAATLTSGSSMATVVIDPASYAGLRNGSAYSDAVMLEYNGIQLQAGGCQGGDIGNGSCSLFNNATGKWELPAYDLSSLKLLVKNGTSGFSFQYAWKDAAGFTGTTATYQVGFEQALPVHLITFTGEKRGSNALLNWKSVNEENFRGYGVERSTDGRSFTQVGFVNGRNLASAQLYSYTDDLSGLSAGRVYYRLKQLDLNGAFTYSPVVTLTLRDQSLEPAVTLLTNPVTTALKLQVRSTVATTARFYFSDGNGRVVFSQQQSLQAGTTALSLDVPAMLSSGVYYLVTQLEGQQFSQKVLVTR
ncbi:hypothetical protein [Flaviaesturariibacter terrae]